jgi:hypothetical protein
MLKIIANSFSFDQKRKYLKAFFPVLCFKIYLIKLSVDVQQVQTLESMFPCQKASQSELLAYILFQV